MAIAATENRKKENGKIVKKKALIENIQIWPLRPLKKKKEKLTNAVRCVYYTSARLHSACAIAATEKKKEQVSALVATDEKEKRN